MSQSITSFVTGALLVDPDSPLPTRDAHLCLESLLKAASIGISFSHVDRRIFRSNSAFDRMLGYRPEELYGLDLRDCIHPEDVEAENTRLRALLSGERDSYKSELRYLRKDKTVFWGSNAVVLVRTDDGVPVAIIDMRLGFGGTFSIESPSPYSAVAKAMISELGIDVPSYAKYFKRDLYKSLGLKPQIFFDKETFGADKLVVNPSPQYGGETVVDNVPGASEAWKSFMADAPLSEAARKDFLRLSQDTKDYFPGLGSEEKKAKLARISYAKFLTEMVGVDPQVVKVYQAAPHPLFGVGIDAVAAQDAWGLGLPGFAGM